MENSENIYLLNECQIYYFGYILCKDGRILSPYQVELSKFNITYEKSHVSMEIEGKRTHVNAARLIYRYFSELLYHEEYDPKKIIHFKDGNTDNTAYDNLEMLHRQDYIMTIKDNTDAYNQKRYDDDTVREIQQKYACKPGKRKKLKNQFGRDNSSMRELSREYGCSLNIMKKILDDKY